MTEKITNPAKNEVKMLDMATIRVSLLRKKRGHKYLILAVGKILVFWDLIPCSLVFGTNVSEEPAVYVSRVEDGGSTEVLVPVLQTT